MEHDDNVTTLNTPWYGKTDPNSVLEHAVDKLDDVLVIGFEKETGELYAATSFSEKGDVYYVIDSFKNNLLNGQYG